MYRPLHLLAPLLHLPELGGILLEAGATVDTRNDALETPLTCACRANNLFLARVLIEKGKINYYSEPFGQAAFEKQPPSAN